MEGPLLTAKKLLEKKKTFLEGVEKLSDLVKDSREQDAKVVLDVLKRCYTVLISRHDDEVFWEKSILLMEMANEKMAGKTGEWLQHMQKARPTKDDKKKEVVQLPEYTIPGFDFDYSRAPPPETPASRGMLTLQDILPELGVSSIEELLPRLQDVNSDSPASLKALHDLTLFRIPHNAKTTEYTCVVCLENLQPRTHAKKMPCKHLFHEPCLMEWLGKQNTCPTCRYALPVELLRASDALEHILPKEAEPMFS